MRLPEALPTISGRWLLAYRLFWLTLFALALAGASWGAWTIRAESMRDTLALYHVGLRWQGPSGLQVGPLDAAAPLEGLAAPADLLAVDGRPVSPAAEGPRAARALEGPEGAAVRVRVRGADGVTREVVLRRSREHLRRFDAASPLGFEARSLFTWAMAALVNLMILAAAVLMFRRRPGDPVAALISTGMLASLAVAPILLLLPGAAAAQAVSVSITAGCLVLGLLLFPGGRFDNRWTWVGAAALAAYLVFRNVAVGALGGLVDAVWSAALLALCVAAIATRFFRAGPGVERQQIKWVLLGAVLYLAFNAMAAGLELALRDAADPAVRVAQMLGTRIGYSLATAALLGGLLVAILRHRLYDAETAISRSVSFGALTLAVVGVFAGAEEAIEVLGQQYLGGSVGGAASAVAAGLAAVLILPLHHRLSAWAERRFQGGLARLKAELPHDMDEMRDIESVGAIARQAAERTAAAVQAVRAAVLVRDEAGDGWEVAAQTGADAPSWGPPAGAAGFTVARADPAYPVRLPLTAGGDEPAGWLLIGPRPDGTLYGCDEREALLEVARPVGRALRVARRREAEAAAGRRRLERLEAAVRDLQAARRSPVTAAS